MDPTQLRDLLVLLREHGVQRYATPDLSLELGPLPQPRSSEPEARPSSKPEDADDLLYWSAQQ